MQDNSLSLIANNMDQMAQWSETKKQDFIDTYSERAEASKYILSKTIELVLHRAKERFFISDRHLAGIDRRTKNARNALSYGHRRSGKDIGGRSYNELDEIAAESARKILRQLPNLATAVRVIDAPTANKIDKRTNLLNKAKQLVKELDALTETVELREWANKNPTKTVAQFLDEMDQRVEARNQKVRELKKLSDEGNTLQKDITKALYEGLPGLSDAVVDWAVGEINKLSSMDAVTRRITETVKFGDSSAATELLRQFEADESKVAKETLSKFKDAMSVLKAAVAKGAKLGDSRKNKKLAATSEKE